ncbi:MAG: hypothetical protein B7Z36_01980 [Novosphingobium sp. 12-63-9]|nr:MAG: hypothetical protein B7Z36_01980 [Novosphingobium sp. 12-63-9]
MWERDQAEFDRKGVSNFTRASNDGAELLDEAITGPRRLDYAARAALESNCVRCPCCWLHVTAGG